MSSSSDYSIPDHRLTILVILAMLILLVTYLKRPLESVTRPKVSSSYQMVATGEMLSIRQKTTEVRKSGGSKRNPVLLPFLFKKLPVNSVNATLLQTIPGIGVELSRRIIEERENNGVYISADDLTRVAGIGVKRAENLKNQLSFTN